jgi:hypothetical protein
MGESGEERWHGTKVIVRGDTLRFETCPHGKGPEMTRGKVR